MEPNSTNTKKKKIGFYSKDTGKLKHHLGKWWYNVQNSQLIGIMSASSSHFYIGPEKQKTIICD
jgi:hypothetical protein